MRRAVVVALVLAGIVAAGLAVRWAGPHLTGSGASDWYAKAAYPLEHAATIRDAARRNHLDPALVAAVIYVESRFDERALSSQGAVGLMQLLPETARQIARETGGVAFVDGDLEDPRVNVRYGCYYLRRALESFDGDLVAAVASYNAGMGTVSEWDAEAASAGHRLRTADIPYAETSAYVIKVLQARRVYRDTYGADLRSVASSG